MAYPFKALSAIKTLLLLAVIIITMLLPQCHADDPSEKTSSIHQPGPWMQAHATFYEGGSGTFGMNSAGLPSQIYLFFFFSC